MKTEDLKEEQRLQMASIQASTQKTLENRVSSALGVVEGTVVLKGDDQFIIEIPGNIKLQDARAILKKYRQNPGFPRKECHDVQATKNL
ncbi:hypothetical protein QPK87_01275 [Kamptonema cortianum]|nr:hypothetical protein [Kamptonema cortianum]